MGLEEERTRVHEKISRDERYVHYLDCGDGFTDTVICPNIKLFTLNICDLLYVNYTSITIQSMFLNDQLLHKISILIIEFSHLHERFVCNCSFKFHIQLVSLLYLQN